MKKSSTIRMSMFCPDDPTTPFGMMDRNVTTRRRGPKSSKKSASSSKLSLRRPEPVAGPPSDQENAPPLTPRRQGRRLFSQPEIVEIEPVAEPPPPPPPPVGLPKARPPLRPTVVQQSNTQESGLMEGCRRKEAPERFAAPRLCEEAEERKLETDALLQKMTEMSLSEAPAPRGAVDGGEQSTATPADEEADTVEMADRIPAAAESSDCRCTRAPPRRSGSYTAPGQPTDVPSPTRSESRSVENPVPVTAAESEPRQPSSDSFVSAASSPVVGRPAAARTPAVRAAPPAIAASPVPDSVRRSDSDSDSGSERSLPYFTPRRPARHRAPAAVQENSSSSDEASETGGGRQAPLLTRALRRLPATTSTPAPGVTAGWRLDATGMPSPVLEADPTPSPPLARLNKVGLPQKAEGVLPGGVASKAGGERHGANTAAEQSRAGSSVIMGEYRRGAAPAAQRTLAEETSEDSSPSVELVTAPARRQKTARPVESSPSPVREPPPPAVRQPSPSPPVAVPAVAARAPLRAPAAGGGRPAASPAARPPRLPPGVSAAVDVARWLEESPLLSAVSEESDVVVIDSDHEWDDSDLLSVSERAAAALVEPDSGLGPPPPPLRSGRVRPERSPQAPPPRNPRRQSSGSSASEDELEKFKRQFVTPRKAREPSPSDGEDNFIDDGSISSDDSSYHRAVATDSAARRTPRVNPQIRASDESLEAAETTPEEQPFLPPPPRQVRRRPAGSTRPTPTPQKGGTLSFMSSLASHLVEGARRHPEAAAFVGKFKSRRLELARRLFDMVNSEVFDSKLPPDMEIKFNKRMLRTAGYCYSRQAVSAGPDGAAGRSARVELSEKVVDSAERLRDTLVHELCHAAAWVVSGYRGGHGPVWRGWAARVQRRFPELPPVTRCHSYQIHCKYTYRCTGCGYSFGRHSKSLDVTRKVCGRCRGVFECVLTARRGEEGGGGATPATPRAAAPFALFVKEHYSAMKRSAGTGTKHADVMRLLGQKFAETKISQAKAKATECEDF
ncbi:nucleolar and coiled-body phosphoprotein 1-like [Amphibalanus amphitrite]|uniref:nucleolar and coiled-body phosphoprotein 1-like n=1 Tax=Amphibalanus amphitrite TaxID=1232801 RepID=UPI001C920375|nr:nucleolar and coiled-body phosphoprotein 1-like [Amphibalanus amphitrite]